jgi:hypothetical protein
MCMQHWWESWFKQISSLWFQKLSKFLVEIFYSLGVLICSCLCGENWPRNWCWYYLMNPWLHVEFFLIFWILFAPDPVALCHCFSAPVFPGVAFFPRKIANSGTSTWQKKEKIASCNGCYITASCKLAASLFLWCQSKYVKSWQWISNTGEEIITSQIFWGTPTVSTYLSSLIFFYIFDHSSYSKNCANTIYFVWYMF